MKTLKLTTEAALLLNERILVDGHYLKYHINTYTYSENGQPVLAEMNVDAYVDGEWDSGRSYCYQLNDELDSKNDEWLSLV